MTAQCWWLIRHTPYRWSNAEPWPWRRDRWTKRHPYPTPLWLRVWERHRLPWLMRRDRRGFARHSPVMRR
jgi:hypothetical protein